MDIVLIKLLISLLLIVVGLEQQHSGGVHAKALFKHRVKRVSDTHITNLETKVALNKFNGIAITLPIGFGRNLDYIGRKRRSQSRFLEKLFNQSEEEDQGDNGIIDQDTYGDNNVLFLNNR